jgi:hypothetical protein
MKNIEVFCKGQNNKTTKKPNIMRHLKKTDSHGLKLTEWHCQSIENKMGKYKRTFFKINWILLILSFSLACFCLVF